MTEAGTLRFDVLQDPATNQAFYVYEVYKNVAAFEKHKDNCPYKRWDSDQFQNEVVAEFWQLFEGEPVYLRWPGPR